MKVKRKRAQCAFCRKKGQLRVTKEGLVILIPGDNELKSRKRTLFFSSGDEKAKIV